MKPSRCKYTTYFLLEIGCLYFRPTRKGQPDYAVWFIWCILQLLNTGTTEERFVFNYITHDFSLKVTCTYLMWVIFFYSRVKASLIVQLNMIGI